MRSHPHHTIRAVFLSMITILALSLSACGGSSASNTGAANGKGCHKIGVLLPETGSSPRWEDKDHPALDAAIKQALPGAQVDFQNANGSDDTQISQADQAISNGDCILVVVPHDSDKAAAIVQDAKQHNVPVIAYDRMINDPSLSYYVSFDGTAVGKAQGDYIAQHYQSYVSPGHNNIIFINGSQADGNAVLFKQGMHNVLDALVSAGTLKSLYETWTPNWDSTVAQSEIQDALQQTANNIQVAYVANDSMAEAVITALKAQHLAGKVLVTGQDATVTAIQNILLGYQAMTVYKPIVKEAQATAQIIAALSNGTSTSGVVNSSISNKGAQTPAALEAVESVDKANVASTVIADNFVTKAEVCQGVPTGVAPDVCG